MTLEAAMERWRSLLNEQGGCSQPFRCSVCGDASLPPCPYAKDCDERLDGEAFNAVASFINRHGRHGRWRTRSTLSRSSSSNSTEQKKGAIHDYAFNPGRPS